MAFQCIALYVEKQRTIRVVSLNVRLLKAITLVVVLATTAGLYAYVVDRDHDARHSPGALRSFSSYAELLSFLRSAKELPGYFFPIGVFGRPVAPAPKELAVSEAGSSVDYSTTNVQVEGVDEADIVKADGEYIYLVSGRKIVIVRAYPPEGAELLSTISVNGTPIAMYVWEDKLIVFSTSRAPLFKEISYLRPSIAWIFDISDRSDPRLMASIASDGFYFDSRRVENYVYLIAVKPLVNLEEKYVLPRMYVQLREVKIDPSLIYHPPVIYKPCMYTVVVAIDLNNPTLEPSYKAILSGPASSIYASRRNLYIAIPSWVNGTVMTGVHRIELRGLEIEYAATGLVPGMPLNQFSMDEHEGYFRIATTTGRVARTASESTARNHIYVLDGSMEVVGRLEDLAPGERIYSARFMGDRCYLVTFRKVDPFFVVDLSDPTSPRVLGKLKIPGYSNYLHPYDENHVIGIGKDTVPAEEGDFSWYQGVKISFFDVSDVTRPKEVAKIVIGDRGTETPVLWDHRALLFDKRRNLLVIPILLAIVDESKYPGGAPPDVRGDYVWQGAYVLEISLERGIVVRGRITHIENGEDLDKSGLYFWSPYSVKRAIYIGDVLYTISDKKIAMNDLEDLSPLGEIELP